MKKLLFLFVCTAGFAQNTLKEAFNSSFKMGVAVNDEIVAGKDPAAQQIVKVQFNTITLENSMKAIIVNPKPGVFNWGPADAYVDFGQKNHMNIIGHTLVYHNQCPEWFFKNENGSPKTKEEVLNRMHEHIKAVAGRYAGKVMAWDVVNEVIDDDGSYRSTAWIKGVGSGEEMVKNAFKWAAQYAPNTELYYNDFNAWRPEKVAGIVRMIKMLQSEGIKIDGVGIQGHWGLNYPKTEYIEAAIDAYAACGVKVMITELDIDVLPITREGQVIGQSLGEKQWQNEEFKNYLDPYKNGLPAEVQQQLTHRYREVFEIFERKKDKIDRVALWGVHDPMSWKNNYPVPGRTNYALLWDKNYQPKPALQAILNIKKTDEKPWNGKKCGVVLTYDDALNVHLDKVIPTLDSAGLKGTFYLTASSKAAQRVGDWRKAALAGHELGNHTVYHPCDATKPGMGWVRPEYDLSKYTLNQIQSEIRMCNVFLNAIDGQTERTFAFTCGHKKVKEGEFMSSLSNDFVAARAVRHEMHHLSEQKLFDIDCYSQEGTTADQMIALVDKAKTEGKLLVLLFHGVGGEHGLNVNNAEHQKLVQYLKAHSDEIYVDTMLNMAKHIKNIQKP